MCKNADSQAFDRVVEDLTTSLHQPRLRIAWGGLSAISSSSQMALQSSSAASTGQVTWSDATTPAMPDVAPSDHVQVVNPFGSKPLSQAVHNSVQST